MEKATISQLKNNLSTYLDKVRAGQSILICDRDQPIAKIERTAPGTGEDDRLARLERAGLIRRSSKKLQPDFFNRRLPKSSKSVLDALLDERKTGR